MEGKIFDLEALLKDKEVDDDLPEAIRLARVAWIEKNGRRLHKEYQEGRRRDRIERIYRSSGMSDLDRQMTFGNFRIDEKNRAARSLVQNYMSQWPESGAQGCGFIIMGRLGVGKTHLCLAFLNQMIDNAVDCEYANVKTALDAAKETFDTHSVTPLRRIKRRDLVLLDDLGSERPTDWTVDALSGIITYRYSKYLPTVFTTNALSWKELISNLSSRDQFAAERIVERIMERNEPVVMGGTSRRKPFRGNFGR